MLNTLKVTSIFYQMNKCFIKSNKTDKKRSITEKNTFSFLILYLHKTPISDRGPSIFNYSILGMQ